MTKDQRKKIIKALDCLYTRVRLVCDGYHVSLVRQPLNPTTNRVLVYVNGHLSAKWSMEDCEERRRFYCPHTQYVHSKQERKAYKKVGLRTLKKYNIDPDRKWTSFTPWWASSARLVRHFEENNKEIILLEENEEVTT